MNSRTEAHLMSAAVERARTRNPRTHALRDRIYDRLDVELAPRKRLKLEAYLFLLDPDLEATPAVVQDVEQMLEAL